MSFWIWVVFPGVVTFTIVLVILFTTRNKRAADKAAPPRTIELFSDLPPRSIRTGYDQVERRLLRLWYKQGYLRSSNWKLKRKKILRRAGYRCELCHATGRLDIHHRTYERLRYELPEDLQALCRQCHRRAHQENKALRLY